VSNKVNTVSEMAQELLDGYKSVQKQIEECDRLLGAMGNVDITTPLLLGTKSYLLGKKTKLIAQRVEWAKFLCQAGLGKEVIKMVKGGRE